MKFAAIADVHGNCVALEAVLADIAALGITEVVNLGDHVSGPLEARRTAELLMARDFPSISGNQDRRLVEIDRAGNGSSRRDYRELDRRHIDWLAGMPPTLLYRDDVFLCHGSPGDDEAYWLDRVTDRGTIEATPIEAIEAEATGIAASLILCGHTHIPRVVRLARRPPRRQRRQRRLSRIRGPRARATQGAGRNARCLLRHSRAHAARLVRHLPLRALRQPVDGGDGKTQRPARMGQRAGHGMDQLSAAARPITAGARSGRGGRGCRDRTRP